MTEAIKNGDTISVNYTGKFETGEVFDTSEGRSPLKFTVGKGMLIKGFDNAVIDMNVGDKKTVTIPPAEGYGERNEDMIVDNQSTRWVMLWVLSLTALQKDALLFV